MNQADPIRHAYAQWVAAHGKRPASIQEFAAASGIDAADISSRYASLRVIEQTVFLDLFLETLRRLRSSPEYASYETAQEQILALMYTWLEVLGQQRAFLLVLHQEEGLPYQPEGYTALTAGPFRQWVQPLLQDGIDRGEIAARMALSQWYQDALWANALVMLRFWLNDRSRNSERTDAAVEKLVRFTFDLLRPNALDSGLDLIRFLIQKP
ncbi:MAG: hypothetical protein NW241_06875 [Bacteroidia bacterium]|nr:hypothetical protein [Bacteroidia bacterium]